MDAIACFNKWAGEHEWSDWAKPTLFAQQGMASLIADPAHGEALLAKADAIIQAGGARTLSAGAGEARTCLVIDHPGEISVALGVALSRRGFAPVPLFNGVYGINAPLVSNQAILQALVDLADRIQPGADPAPAFLLDSGRLAGQPAPKRYDNRWVVFPQDFPSGGRLLASGIRECAILADPPMVRDDLCHVLRRWQDAGMTMIEAWGETKRETSIPIPPWYRQVFYRMVALAGLRPNAYGGFGALIPEPGQGGGYG
jgi:hypothetical protein